MRKNLMKMIMLTCFAALFIFPVGLNGQEPTRWRGPEASGVYPDRGLLESWPEEGPEMIWHTDGLGKGFSSPVFAGDKIYLTGMLGSTGNIFVMDMSGKVLKKYPYGDEFTESYAGSRSSVTVAGGLLYIMSGNGRLVCLEESSGKIVWQKELFRDFDGRNITWGVTETLVVDGEVIYCTPGGEKNNVLALNRLNGDLIWSGQGRSEKSAYCTPLIVELPARKILVTMTENHILGLDTKDGRLLWSHPQTNEYSVHANTPLYHDGSLFCFSGYGQGGVMLELSEDGSRVTEKWRSAKMDSRMGGAVYYEGHIYGSGDLSRIWFCADWKTGEFTYTSTELTKGVVILADGKLFAYSQRGELAMIKADPDKFEILGNTKVELGTEQHWAHPVINDGILYVRHGEVLMAYKIK